jgi:hypothetical protein
MYTISILPLNQPVDGQLGVIFHTESVVITFEGDEGVDKRRKRRVEERVQEREGCRNMPV